MFTILLFLVGVNAQGCSDLYFGADLSTPTKVSASYCGNLTLSSCCSSTLIDQFPEQIANLSTTLATKYLDLMDLYTAKMD